MAKKEKKVVAKAKSQEELIRLVDQKHGAGALMQGRGKIVDVDVFPTGVMSIDIALGCGGLPQGRIMELYGPESSGKTTTCLQFIAACQNHTFKQKEREGVCAFIDAEHALDPAWAENNGVDMDQLLISQPSSGEEAFSIVEMMIKSRLVDLIIVDSVAALVPQVELDGELKDANIGAHARLMSKALRVLKGDINKSNTTVIFINQIREKVGIIFGSPEVTPGGRALKFYASIRAEVKRLSAVKDGDETVAFKTRIKIVKNKVAPPFMQGEFDICFGKPSRPIYGIDAMSSLLFIAIGDDMKIVKKSGSFYSYGDMRMGNGVGKASAFLQENPEIAEKIRKQIYDVAFGSLEKVKVSESDEPDDLDNELLDDD